jgi:hypothetical protein
MTEIEIDKARIERLHRRVETAYEMYPTIGFGDLVYLVRIAKAYDALVEAAIPCQSCGADPRVSPPTNEELPIVRGALDEQAAAETKCWAAQHENEFLRNRLRLAESTIADLKESKPAPGERVSGGPPPDYWARHDCSWGTLVDGMLGDADSFDDAVSACWAHHDAAKRHAAAPAVSPPLRDEVPPWCDAKYKRREIAWIRIDGAWWPTVVLDGIPVKVTVDARVGMGPLAECWGPRVPEPGLAATERPQDACQRCGRVLVVPEENKPYVCGQCIAAERPSSASEADAANKETP